MRALLQDRRGGVAVMAAVSGGLLCALAALVIDVASVALYARKLQGAADLSALAAARDLGRIQDAARATAQANVGTGVTVKAVSGVYVAEAEVAAKDRFHAGQGPANAARVTLSGQAPLHFGRWILGRTAWRCVAPGRRRRRTESRWPCFPSARGWRGWTGGWPMLCCRD